MKNKSLAIETIKNDCKIAHHYINEQGETCAIGALALAVGLTLPDVDDTFKQNDPINHLPLCGLLMEKYNLSESTLSLIQAANDENETPESRRKAILALLEDEPDEQ